MKATACVRPTRDKAMVRPCVRMSDASGDTYAAADAPIPRADWNERTRKVRTGSPVADELNAVLSLGVDAAHRYVLAERAAGRAPTRTGAKAAVLAAWGREPVRPDPFTATVASIVRADAEERRTAGQLALAAKLRVVAGHVERIAPRLRIGDLQAASDAARLDAALARGAAHGPGGAPLERPMSDATRASLWRGLSGVVRRAVERGTAPPASYAAVRSVRITSEPKQRGRLSAAEFARVEALALDPPAGTPDHVRAAAEAFTLAVYLLGARVGDVMRLRRSMLTLDDGAVTYAAWRMSKTGTPLRVPVSPVASAILLRWLSLPPPVVRVGRPPPRLDGAGPPPDGPIAPQMRGRDVATLQAEFDAVKTATAGYNKALRDVARRCEVAAAMSSHVARATFGNLARERGMTRDEVRDLYRHGSGAVTERYLHELDQVVLDARAVRALSNPMRPGRDAGGRT